MEGCFFQKKIRDQVCGGGAGGGVFWLFLRKRKFSRENYQTLLLFVFILSDIERNLV